MLAPFATLAFLATLWLLFVIGADMVRSGRKVVAAFNGKSMLATAPLIRPIAGRVSQRSRQRPLRARPQLRLRAAA